MTPLPRLRYLALALHRTGRKIDSSPEVMKMRHSFTYSLLGVFLMAAILQNAEARPGGSVKVFTLEDGVAFTMGKTDSKRLIYPAMGCPAADVQLLSIPPGR